MGWVRASSLNLERNWSAARADGGGVSEIVRGTLGRYQLGGMIGRGGFARAYRACALDGVHRGRDVCVKIAHPGSCRQTAQEEARLLAQLHHPGIVRLLDHAPDPRDGLVLELISGMHLGQLRPEETGQPTFTLGTVAWIGAAICHALGALPSGVVHRDITPQNVLVSHGGRVALTDFGIARAPDRVASTAPGKIKGKLAYASPEQLLAQPLDARSDLFSLGIVLWELLHGCHPFRQTTLRNTAAAIVEGSPRGGEPSPLQHVLGRLLAKELASRPRDALEAAAFFESLANPAEGAQELRQRLLRTGPGVAATALRADALRCHA